MLKELKTAIHPRQVKTITLDRRPVESEIIRSVNAYIVCYIVIFAGSLLAISFENCDLVTKFTAVSATINNVGPGLSKVGPMGNYSIFSLPSKLVLIFDMLAGRLELFPILVLFSPKTWRR